LAAVDVIDDSAEKADPLPQLREPKRGAHPSKVRPSPWATAACLLPRKICGWT